MSLKVTPLEITLQKYEAIPESGCWIWMGGIQANGYGRVSTGRHKPTPMAHRVFYEALVGAIPVGLHIDHLCRVRCCVNPDHLEPVTPAENNLRGIGYAANNARKTHCLRGHELAGANLYLFRNRRICRACCRLRDGKWKAS